jgi:nucleotide-binding universal stress UspA family protein
MCSIGKVVRTMSVSPVRRVLVATDFSTCSADALRFAQALAGALGASIDVLHVVDPTAARRLGGGEPPATDPVAARGQLEAFVAATGNAAAVPLVLRVESGTVHERIAGIAQQEGFDLVVMGTHGWTGRAQSLVGSVAESVVRTSARPVLTVREGTSHG